MCLVSAGIAALAVALDSRSGKLPADGGWQDARPAVSASGTIYSHAVKPRAGSDVRQVRLASLETDFAFAAAAAGEGQAMAAIAIDRASLAERFASSFGRRFSSFDERFASTTDDGPVPDRTPRSRALPTPQLDADSVAAPEPAKRQNARLAMLRPESAQVARAPIPAPPNKPMRVADTSSDAMSPTDLGRRTAIYDISARVVYLPNGERLEAHSGLGSHMDDPRSVRIKNRGATPPNVYKLSLREQPFHGVRAIRLTPVDDNKMLGRDGLLAHSYLLGPNGESNGCVSFSDYPKFLDAFLKGEVDRLVVVEQLASAPGPKTGMGWLAERLKELFRFS